MFSNRTLIVRYSIGLGRSQVNGLSRVPDPPAISTARIYPPD